MHVACFHARGRVVRPRRRGGRQSIAEFPVDELQPSEHAARRRWAFARWCRARGIAVVHTTDLYANIFALPAAALAGVPVRIGNRREINPDKTLGADRAAARRLRLRAQDRRELARRRRRLGARACPGRKIAVDRRTALDCRPFAAASGAPRRSAGVVVVANLRRKRDTTC